MPIVVNLDVMMARRHDAFYVGANACIRPRVDAIIDPYKVHGSRMK